MVPLEVFKVDMNLHNYMEMLKKHYNLYNKKIVYNIMEVYKHLIN